MKKKYLKTLLLVSILVCSLTMGNVRAVRIENGVIQDSTEKITGTLYFNPELDVNRKKKWIEIEDGDGFHFGSTYMAFKPEGEEKIYEAYCAWYEDKSPTTYENGKITFVNAKLPQSRAMAVAAILEDEEITSRNSLEEKKILKTVALNLYLSVKGEMAGRGSATESNANRFNYHSMHSKERMGEILDRLDDKWGIQNNNKINDPKDVVPEFEKKYLANKNSYYGKVYSLYKVAIDAEEKYNKIEDKPSVGAVLEIDNENSNFSLIDGNYVKIYQLKSNVTLESLNATITGMNRENVRIKTDVSQRTITVSIPQEVFESEITAPIEAKLNITATAKEKQAYIYYAEGTERKEWQQDIVILTEGVEPVSVSATATIKSKTCYRYVPTCTGTACSNKQGNERECNSEAKRYYALTCGENDNNTNQYGKLVYTQGECQVYCTETAIATYPGNVNSAISIGESWTWPSGPRGEYPLTTESTMTCKVMKNDGSNCPSQVVSEIASKFKYEDGANNAQVKYDDLMQTQEIKLNRNCHYDIKVDGNGMEVGNYCTYQLPSGVNNVFDKSILQTVSDIKSDIVNARNDYLILVAEGRLLSLPEWNAQLSKDIDFKYSYPLQIRNLPLGYMGVFTEELNRKIYECYYKITDRITTSCICESGTMFAGLDLYKLIQGKNDLGDYLTCAEAKEKYCNIDPIPDPEFCEKYHELCYCPPDSNFPKRSLAECLMKGKDYGTCVAEKKCYEPPNCESEYGNKCYCPTDSLHPELSLEDCLKEEGKNYNDCVVEYQCYGLCENCCPEGSNYPGKDLTDCMNNGKSATQCEKELCYEIPPNRYYCPENSKNPGADMTSCLELGGTYGQCYELMCNCSGGECEYFCPEGTKNKGMNITNCVRVKQILGSEIGQAIQTCQKQLCYGTGKTIIYRTISLENPFPSMDADKNRPPYGQADLNALGYVQLSNDQLETLNKTFNQNVKGRYPGSNWNSAKLVYNKILNNRGYQGSKIYEEAKALYVIELDATAIKKIREYNANHMKSGGYADFTLTCTEGAYCISNFLRDKNITTATKKQILTDGTCMEVVAGDKKSFKDCLTK